MIVSNIANFHLWITRRLKIEKKIGGLCIYLGLFIIPLVRDIPTIIIYLTASLGSVYYYYRYFHNLGRAWMITLFSISLICISLFFSRDMSHYLHIALNWETQFVLEFIIHFFSIYIFSYVENKYQLLNSLVVFKKKQYYSLAIYTIISLIIVCIECYLNGKNLVSFYFNLQWTAFLFIFLISMIYNIYIESQLNEIYTNRQLFMQREEYYRELDGFRHDFKSLLFSLYVTVEEKNISETKTILNSMKKYSDPIIEYNQFTNIDSKIIHGLLEGLQNEAKEKGVYVKITIPEKVFFNHININLFDLVRLISIITNNAVEESEKEKSEVSLFIFNKHEDHIKIICKNKISVNHHINVNQLLMKNYTTKDEHKGLGLSNFEKISKKYKNLVYKFTVNKQSQEFIVTIDIFH